MNTYICYECKSIMTPTLDNKKMICNNCKLSTELFFEEKEKMSKHNDDIILMNYKQFRKFLKSIW